MNIVVVLSGGGAKGSFQVGALEALAGMGVEDHVSAFTGVSVGSLNAALAAQMGMGNMDIFWRDIRSKNVYKKYSKIRSLWRLASTGGSRSSKPLYALIKNLIHIGEGKPSYAGAANLDRGKYETFRSDDPDYLRALVASSAIPAIIPPVTIRGNRYWDGGILNMTPLGQALSLNPDGLIIITCNPHPGFEREPVEGKIKGLELLKRSLSMLMDEGFHSDLREFIYRNEMEGYKHIPYVLISPSAGLGDSDDFSERLYDARYAKGRIEALGKTDEITALLGDTPQD